MPPRETLYVYSYNVYNRIGTVFFYGIVSIPLSVRVLYPLLSSPEGE